MAVKLESQEDRRQAQQWAQDSMNLVTASSAPIDAKEAAFHFLGAFFSASTLPVLDQLPSLSAEGKTNVVTQQHVSTEDVSNLVSSTIEAMKNGAENITISISGLNPSPSFILAPRSMNGGIYQTLSSSSSYTPKLVPEKTDNKVVREGGEPTIVSALKKQGASR